MREVREDSEEAFEGERSWRITQKAFAKEVKKISCIAAPMVAVMMFQFLPQVVSMVIIGHLGELALSSVAIAVSLANVTGFSLHFGLAGGLETLCGQAYGAKEYRRLGVYTYSAIISLIMTCPLVSLLWSFWDKLLPLLGQDPKISHEARRYSMWLIPALFASAVLRPMTLFLQTQSLTFPLFMSSFVILCFHALVCWTLVFKLGLGMIGGALSNSVSKWLHVVLLGAYIMFSPNCDKTRARFSYDAFIAIAKFFRLGVPSAVMICLKWWTLELLILLAGLMPNSKLETSVLSICFSISTLHFQLPLGLAAAASTRVSNELGAGNPQPARMATLAVVFLASIEAILVSTALFLSRPVLGYAYSNDNHVVKHVAAMIPLVCLFVITDSLQGVLGGVLRGSGLQRVGAYINLGAFYIIGVPLGSLLGFGLHLRGKGLWVGVVAGSIVQTCLFSLLACFTNWQTQAAKAKKRLSESQ